MANKTVEISMDAETAKVIQGMTLTDLNKAVPLVNVESALKDIKVNFNIMEFASALNALKDSGAITFDLTPRNKLDTLLDTPVCVRVINADLLFKYAEYTG